MLKKSFGFIILLVISIFAFTSCSKSNYSWDDILKDVNLLREKKYVIYLENSKENQENANKEFISWGLNIRTTNIIGCCKENTNVIYFEEFENKKQAKELYDYQISNLGNDRSIKFCLKGNILISSNIDEANDLLGYKFK